jgi:hypothetical protein
MRRYIERSRALALAVMLCAGCASLNERPPLNRSLTPDPARAYLYGRFSLEKDSSVGARLFLQLMNLDTQEFLTVPFRRDGQDPYVVDVAPGRYQFTHAHQAPYGAMAVDVRRAPLGFPDEARAQATPFRVEAVKGALRRGLRRRPLVEDRQLRGVCASQMELGHQAGGLRLRKRAPGRFRGNARAALEDRLARLVQVGQHRGVDMEQSGGAWDCGERPHSPLLVELSATGATEAGAPRLRPTDLRGCDHMTTITAKQ